jgi:hypothetical protein
MGYKDTWDRDIVARIRNANQHLLHIVLCAKLPPWCSENLSDPSHLFSKNQIMGYKDTRDTLVESGSSKMGYKDTRDTRDTLVCRIREFKNGIQGYTGYTGYFGV